MSTAEFWIKVWKILGAVFCVVFVSGLGSCQATRYQMVEMVEAGATPRQAACAFNLGFNGTSAECIGELVGDKQ